MPTLPIVQISNAKYSEICLLKSILTFEDLLHFLRHLPYKRISKKEEPILVLKENRGTCSSKHAFAKKVADEQGWPMVKLLLVIYKLNPQNTPGIGNALEGTDLTYVPEAHTILEVEGKPVDITFPNSDFKKLSPFTLSTKEIEAHQAGSWKQNFHQTFIKQWIAKNGVQLSFDDIWQIREQCIANLQKE